MTGVANSALASLPRRGGDGGGVAGALPLRQRGGDGNATDGALLSLPQHERRATATGTVCSGALPPLRRRDGDGHSVVREKGDGEEKRQVRGRGEEKRCNKMRAASGAGASQSC